MSLPPVFIADSENVNGMALNALIVNNRILRTSLRVRLISVTVYLSGIQYQV